MVGGGARGKGVGIAHGIMMRVGPAIEVNHLSIEGYQQTGGMTTGIIVGESINGTTNQSPTNNFNGIGTPGEKTGIGRSKPGESRG